MGWDYKRVEPKSALYPGDYRVEIVTAEERLSKGGNHMIVIGLKPNGYNLKIQHYIVDGQYFNVNMTRFFDCFDVEEGNFDFPGWIGAQGAVRLVQDTRDPRFLKVGYLIARKNANDLPPWTGPLPERHRIVDGSAFIEVSDEDLNLF